MASLLSTSTVDSPSCGEQSLLQVKRTWPRGDPMATYMHPGTEGRLLRLSSHFVWFLLHLIQNTSLLDTFDYLPHKSLIPAPTSQ